MEGFRWARVGSAGPVKRFRFNSWRGSGGLG